MTIYKLRILPLFLLVIGLTTLTSGCKKKDMSLKLNEPRNIRGVVSYKRSFPDLNDAHLEVAKKNRDSPIGRPGSSRRYERKANSYYRQ